jgi:hypothetical protein
MFCVTCPIAECEAILTFHFTCPVSPQSRCLTTHGRSVGRSPWRLPLVHQHISIVRGGAWQLCARQLWLFEDLETLLCCRFVLTAALRVLPACLPLQYGQNAHNRGQWSQRNILHLFYNVISFTNVVRSKMTPNTVQDTFSKQFVLNF